MLLHRLLDAVESEVELVGVQTHRLVLLLKDLGGVSLARGFVDVLECSPCELRCH